LGILPLKRHPDANELPEHRCQCQGEGWDARLGPCQAQARARRRCAKARGEREDEHHHEGDGRACCGEHDGGHEHADHDHDHSGHKHGLFGGHAHERTKDKKRLLGALALTGSMMVAEIIGGLASGSLALLSDAGHMLTDAAALLLALLALWFAGRPADLKRTFGFFRLEILSALLNGLTLIAIAGFIGYEAWQRISDPQPIRAGLMLGVAVVGLVVNLGGMAILSHSHSMNVRGAFLHVLGDTLSSVGVIVAALVTWLTGWTILDPIISIVIALVIAFSAFGLIRRAVHVLIEGVPDHIDLVEVFGAMKQIEGVASVHDLHVWTIANQMHALSAHLVIESPGSEVDRDRVLLDARRVLRERFGIDHSTLQIESDDLSNHHAHSTH
jgi:cobalt-zinc-cadmium efflux system protein